MCVCVCVCVCVCACACVFEENEGTITSPTALSFSNLSNRSPLEQNSINIQSSFTVGLKGETGVSLCAETSLRQPPPVNGNKNLFIT